METLLILKAIVPLYAYQNGVRTELVSGTLIRTLCLPGFEELSVKLNVMPKALGISPEQLLQRNTSGDLVFITLNGLTMTPYKDRKGTERMSIKAKGFNIVSKENDDEILV